MSVMKAVDIKGGKGGADALFINDQVPRPKAGRGKALVQVRAFGLNRMDLFQREGHYPPPPGESTILGVEFSGTVVELGPAEEGDDNKNDVFAVGDAVFGLAYGGAYAEYVAVSVRTLLHKPASLEWHQAAGIPETWMTAIQALHEVGEFKTGQKALWHAGASGVSIAGTQLSRLAGASAVYTTAGSDAKCAFTVDELGAAASFNYKTQSWVDEVARVTDGRGVDFIVDYIGKDYFQKNLTAAAPDAHIVLLAFLSGSVLPAGVDLSPILRKRLRIEGSGLRSRDAVYQARVRDRLEAVLPHFQTGELKLFIDKVLPWTDIREAHKHMEKDVSKGKIICTIP